MTATDTRDRCTRCGCTYHDPTGLSGGVCDDCNLEGVNPT